MVKTFFKYQQSISHSSPGALSAKGISVCSLYSRASVRDAFGFESLGKACAEFRCVIPGCVLGLDDFAATEIIYSLATGKM